MNDPHDQGPLTAEAEPVSVAGAALPCADRSAEQAAGSATAVGRRSFLEWLTYALGAGAAAVLGVPLVGYFFGTERGKVEWVPLGPVDKFPLNETRVVNFPNPLRTSWDGITAMTGVFVRKEKDENQHNKFPGAQRELCPLGLPRLVVPAIRLVHVSLPRRSVLRQQHAGVRAAAAQGSMTASRGFMMGSLKSRHRIIRPCKTR